MRSLIETGTPLSAPPWPSSAVRRSEEHTSELQSQSNLVCRLLLEKKKKKITQHHTPLISHDLPNQLPNAVNNSTSSVHHQHSYLTHVQTSHCHCHTRLLALSYGNL